MFNFLSKKAYDHIFAVGDIHGMYDKLIDLMHKVPFNPSKDIIIFLGDYIDRGTQNLKSLDYVMDFQEKFQDSIVCLLGNHELFAINYFNYHFNMGDWIEDLNYSWLHNGGFETSRELLALPSSEILRRLDWLKSLPSFYQIDNYYFCHAGIRPGTPLSKQKDADLLWTRYSFLDKYRGKETIVVGHTPVQRYLSVNHITGVPATKPLFLKNNIIMCDTGSFVNGGMISCVDVLSKNYWQA